MNGPLFNLIGVGVLTVIPALCWWVFFRPGPEDKDGQAAWFCVSSGVSAIWLVSMVNVWNDYAHYLGGFPK